MSNIINFGGGGSGGDTLLIPKTINANGRYLPSSDDADGYSEVTVNVNSISPSPALPAEYQRVEYLNIQGGYFEVTVPSSSICKCTFDTSESSTTRSQGIFGGRNSSSNANTDWYLLIANDLSSSYFWLRNLLDTTLVQATNITPNTPVTVWGNVTTKSTHTYIGVYNPFDGGSYKTAKYEFYGKLYTLTGYTISVVSGIVGLVPIYDFIPCYRKSDDQVGVYDVISDTFYTPTILTISGVPGTVTAGPDVN